MTTRPRHLWMDVARGLCSLMICAGHLRGAMFLDYSQLAERHWWDTLFYALTGQGRQLVMVFYVLSGFFIGGSVLQRWQGFRFDEYLMARLTRLMVVLLPALMITVAVDSVHRQLNPGLFEGRDFAALSSGPMEGGNYSLSWRTLLLNLLFLQNLAGPVYGSNGPLWTLGNEFWFYLSFPLGVHACNRNRSLPSRLCFALLALLISMLVLRQIWAGFVIWLLGVAVHLAYQSHWVKGSPTLCWVALALQLASVACADVLYRNPSFWNAADILSGFSSALLLVALKEVEPKRIKGALAIGFRWLAEMSFTLYLVHFPLVLLTFTVFFRKGQQRLSAVSLAWYLLHLTILLVISRLLWHLFERRTPGVRAWLRRRLQRLGLLQG
jgi:peptidoglycan/LPS O-acetylase OafA/YrhL